MIGQSLQTFSNAQILVCFVGFIFITIFVQKFAERAFQNFFPKNEELHALKREIADLREIMLVVAVKTGVDVAEFKSLAGRG